MSLFFLRFPASNFFPKGSEPFPACLYQGFPMYHIPCWTKTALSLLKSFIGANVAVVLICIPWISRQADHFPICLANCFPDTSVGKESACNAGDPRLIPGLGRSPGKGIDYPLQYFWTSLVAQLVKSLGWEHPLEKGKVTLFSILAWRIPWTESQRVEHD